MLRDYRRLSLHSILVIFQCIWCSRSDNDNTLYIPFWLYSNYMEKSRKRWGYQTLHSILVIFQYSRWRCCRFCSTLYIPFWLYSNLMDANYKKSMENTLHSILVIFQFEYSIIIFAVTLNFTFHSGYIPIHSHIAGRWAFIDFTFHSGYIPIFLNA